MLRLLVTPEFSHSRHLFTLDWDLPGQFSFTLREHAFIAQLHCTISSQERAITSTSCCAGSGEGLEQVEQMMMAQRVTGNAISVSEKLPVFCNYFLVIDVSRNFRPVIFSRVYGLNWHWFLTLSFDLVNTCLQWLLITGSLRFQTETLAVPLCVAPLCHSHLHSLGFAVPSTKKINVTDHGAISLSCEPTVLSLDSLVQQHFLYTEDLPSSQRQHK